MVQSKVVGTKLWAIGLVLICTLLISVAQVFFKLGAEKLNFSIVNVTTNTYLIIGVLLYMLGSIFLLASFRGGEVSVLYPIIATSYIWVSLLSISFLNEQMNLFKWVGVFVIVVGIALIGYGSNSASKNLEGG